MTYLDDPGPAAAANEQVEDQVPERLAALTPERLAVLALEIDGLCTELVVKCLEFGHTKGRFAAFMGVQWDRTLMDYMRTLRAGQAMVAQFRAAATGCGLAGCTITEPHDHVAKEGT